VAPQIKPYDSEIVPALGNVRFDVMRPFADDDDLERLESDIRQEVAESVQAWLESLPDDADVYEALTAVSVSYNELRWERGIIVEQITDHRAKQRYLRVAQSLYTTDPIALAKQKILDVMGTLSAAQHSLKILLEEIGAK
jgi:hypothetical protein